jgi:hypothetical protein
MTIGNEIGLLTIFEGSADWDASLAQIDIEAVRRKFSELFDRAAHANTLAGFDLDDVLVERHIVCTIDGVTRVKVSADHLSDRERFMVHVLSTVNAADHGGPCPAYVTEQVKIVELRVTVIRENRALSTVRHGSSPTNSRHRAG